MSQGKHGPCRFEAYRKNLDARLQQFLRRDFVLAESLSFNALPTDLILLEGRVECLQGLCVDVLERLRVLSGCDHNATVKRSGYSYNVALTGVGNVMRYDSPHISHRQEHHVHRYDVLSGDTEGTVEFIYDESQTPALYDVLEETSMWFYENYERLQRL